MLGTKVTSVDRNTERLVISTEPAEGGEPETKTSDVVLVAIGRRPYTEHLGLEAVGLTTDNYGRIEVDQNLATSVEGIYAIGDVVRGPMLAHKAEDEGVFLAERLAGQKPHINYDAVPAVVYTGPEVASVGKTEEDLKEAGIAFKAGKFPFSANSRARATGNTDGFVKILADAKTDRLLGVHIIGEDAGTMIAEAALAIEFGASSEDLARTCHAHPTLEEAVKEAALATHGLPLHI
jgi:dihydrolipoamide dehydrogenase